MDVIGAEGHSVTDGGPEYIRLAGSLGPQIAAASDEIERRGELPAEIVSTLIENGFFRLLQPRSLGGAELDPMSFVQVLEEVARHNASAAWCLGQNNGCSMTAAYLDPAVAKTIFGPPDGILAWGPGPATMQRVPGGYRLSGTWSFASGSHHATWLGAHVPEPDGSGAIRTLLFSKTSAEMKDTWHVVGLRGTGSDGYSVTHLFVPAESSPCRAAPRSGRASRGGFTASLAEICTRLGMPGWRSASLAACSKTSSSWPATRFPVAPRVRSAKTM